MNQKLWDAYMSVLQNDPRYVSEEEKHSFEERVDRCRLMGIQVCICSSVEREEGRVMIHRFDCPIHGRTQ